MVMPIQYDMRHQRHDGQRAHCTRRVHNAVHAATHIVANGQGDGRALSGKRPPMDIRAPRFGTQTRTYRSADPADESAHTGTSASRQMGLARRSRATNKNKKQTANNKHSEAARQDGAAEGGTARESGKRERDASVRRERHVFSHATCCMLSAAPRGTLSSMRQVVFCVLICPDVTFGTRPCRQVGARLRYNLKRLGSCARLRRTPSALQPSPGAEVAGVSPVPVQRWQG